VREVVKATAAAGSPGLDSMEHPDCSPALPDVWICPKCGARLVGRNLWHSCGQFTLEDLFAGTGSGVLELARGYVAMHRWLSSPRIVKQVDDGPRWPGHDVGIQASTDLDDGCAPGSRKRTTSSGCRPTCRTRPAAGQAPAQASDRSFADEPGAEPQLLHPDAVGTPSTTGWTRLARTARQWRLRSSSQSVGSRPGASSTTRKTPRSSSTTASVPFSHTTLDLRSQPLHRSYSVEAAPTGPKVPARSGPWRQLPDHRRRLSDPPGRGCTGCGDRPLTGRTGGPKGAGPVAAS
jgi:hypothetical protein